MGLELYCIKGNEMSHSAHIDRQKLETFQREHDAHIDKPSRDPIFGHTYSYLYTPSGIGTMVSIVCECGKKEDITDSGLW